MPSKLSENPQNFSVSVCPTGKILAFGKDTVIYCQIDSLVNIDKAGVYRVNNSVDDFVHNFTHNRHRFGISTIWPLLGAERHPFSIVRVWPVKHSHIRTYQGSPVIEFTSSENRKSMTYPEDHICDLLIATDIHGKTPTLVREGSAVQFDYGR